MMIPRNALVDKNKVFIVQEGKLKKLPVVIEKTNDTEAFITGLPEGADVVVEPLINGREGITAEILQRP
jgi:hypothetical protein